MALDILVQEARGMSEDALMEVVRYMRYIKTEEVNISVSATVFPNKKGRSHRKAGKYRGQGWMPDDFDAPLDDFKEYM